MEIWLRESCHRELTHTYCVCLGGGGGGEYVIVLCFFLGCILPQSKYMVKGCRQNLSSSNPFRKWKETTALDFLQLPLLSHLSILLVLSDEPQADEA